MTSTHSIQRLVSFDTSRSGKSRSSTLDFSMRTTFAGLISKNSNQNDPGKYVAKSFVDSTVSMSDFDNMSELAAIILSRAQLRKGQPQLALDLLVKHADQHGESTAIAEEIAKVEGALLKS